MARSPLFDIYDPGGILQQQAQYGLLPDADEELDPIGIVPLGPRKPTLSDLMPEEEKKTWLRSLASMGASGLSGLGWLLDTPGAVVRGTLSGGLGKGLAALWETTDDRVEGRELARQYGLAGKDDTWSNYLGGLATEILLDPLTYGSLGLNAVLGKGAKTAGGRAAQGAGLLDDFDLYAKNVKKMGTREAMREATARELLEKIPEKAARDEATQRFLNLAKNDQTLLDQPLAQMNRVSLPWVYEGAADLYGKNVGDFVAKAADKLGDSAKLNPYTGPAVRGIQAAFDPNVLGMTDYDRQWEARAISAARRSSEKDARRTLIGLQMDADNALRKSGSSLQDFSPDLRDYFEHGHTDMWRPERPELSDLPEVRKLMGWFDGYKQQAVDQAARLGIPLDEFTSRADVGFFPRQQAVFDVQMKPKWPAGVTPNERQKRGYTQGSTVAPLTDNAGRGRKVYTDIPGGTRTLNAMSLDRELQESLRGADGPRARQLLQDWWAKNGDGESDLYGWIDQLSDEGDFVHSVPDLPSTHPTSLALKDIQERIARATLGGEEGLVASLKKQAKGLAEQAKIDSREYYRDSLYNELADFNRTLDPQHAERNLPVFGQNSFNELSRYVMGRTRVGTNATELMGLLKGKAERQAKDLVTGGVNYDAYETLKKLGFTGETAPEVLSKQLGVSPEDLANVSFNKKFVDDWSSVIQRGMTPPEIAPIMQAYDNFTKSFKTLALLWPARYTRDAYSGMAAAAAKGAFSPSDWWAGTRIRKGDYSAIPNKLRHLPDYQGLTDEQIVRKFLTDAGAEGLGTSTVSDELTQGVAGAQVKELYPGMARPQDLQELAERVRNAQLVRGWNPLNSDWSPFAVRGSGGNRNPLLEAGDRAAEFTDAGNRYGTYLNQIRKGKSPSEAARIADLTQVNYRNSTYIEREYLKRALPFYSYSRGILPLIADQLIDQPTGLLGLSTRAINRAGSGSEDSFVPEYLRQSASVPVPNSFPLIGLDQDSKLKRFLTNIDLPWESVINLVTPGTGNNVFDKVGNSVRKTALNLLGQTNPLIKGPLELATNRQFYSGRQLSDLYSLLEQPLGSPGRVLEQVIVNTPGGSRILGAVRQGMDDRLAPGDKWSKFLFNALTGLKFQDVDEERTKRLAARDMLNQLLETTPGVRTFENIDIPPDVLAKMPEQQKRMFLLYRIIQSEAAKRARDRKKREMAMDPLQVLGVVRDA